MYLRSMLPPPDPHESPFDEPPGDVELSGPTAVFPCGTPSRETERLADAIVKARPGILFVTLLA
jgi:hypothetical protein